MGPPRGGWVSTMRFRRSRVLAATMSVTLAVLTGMVAAGRAEGDVHTVSVDYQRTGWDQHEPGLSPASVTSSDFGQLFATQLDGQVYAEPLVIGSTLVVATERNKVYGLDKVTGKILWTRTLGKSWPT